MCDDQQGFDSPRDFLTEPARLDKIALAWRFTHTPLHAKTYAMSLHEILYSYGYLAVFIGTFLEGEAILILGGIAAQLGYLQLPLVITAAFTGTLAGDQLYFYLGRRHGYSWLYRYPNWQPRLAHLQRFLERHQIWLMLSFRFLYGLRTIASFAIGMSSISATRFFVLNTLGALLWAVVVAVFGYVLGQVVGVVVNDIKRYELWLLGSVALLGAGVWAARFWRREWSA